MIMPAPMKLFPFSCMTFTLRGTDFFGVRTVVARLLFCLVLAFLPFVRMNSSQFRMESGTMSSKESFTGGSSAHAGSSGSLGSRRRGNPKLVSSLRSRSTSSRAAWASAYWFDLLAVSKGSSLVRRLFQLEEWEVRAPLYHLRSSSS